MNEKHRSLARCPVIVPETRTEISHATLPIAYIAIVGAIYDQEAQVRIREFEPPVWFEQTCLIYGSERNDRLNSETSSILEERPHHCISAP